jgi:cathepsin L
VALSALGAVFAATALFATDTAKMQVATHMTVAHAQEYIQRETAASPAVKAKIAAIRQRVAKEKLTFTVGYTEALDRPLSVLAATQAPRGLGKLVATQNIMAMKLLTIDRQARSEYARINPNQLIELKISCAAGADTFDWRSLGKVTSVKNQQCGNCWAYASVGAYEASFLIRNGQTIDASEHYIVSCAKYDNGNRAGTCKGGWHAGVFEYFISLGDILRTPDTGTDGTCTVVPNAPYRAVAWGYVNASPASGIEDGIPSRADMKAALCEHGPLAVAVLATEEFQAYTGGVFKENLPAWKLTPIDSSHPRWKYHSINHDILLIGWNDAKHAWLIKNSWGTCWGETGGMGADKGYMWIDYDSNNIGLGAAWVEAQNQAYRMPREYYQIAPHVKPFPETMILE